MENTLRRPVCGSRGPLQTAIVSPHLTHAVTSSYRSMPNPALRHVWGIDLYLYAVMVGPFIWSSISCSFNLLVCKRQNKVKIICIKLFMQHHITSLIMLMSYMEAEDCVSAKNYNGWLFVWPERALGHVLSSTQLCLEEVWGMLPLCISSLHHSGTKCCRRNLSVRHRQKYKTGHLWISHTKHPSHLLPSRTSQ